MKDRQSAVCFDLDSTIANTAHRRHLLPEDRAEGSHWHAYSAACAGDGPIRGTLRLMQLLWLSYQIHIVSGRTDSARSQTERWLTRHGVQWDYLSLRLPEDDLTPNDELKVRYVRVLQGRGVPVELFAEDWVPVAQAIERETGVPVLVVNPCDPPGAANPVLSCARGGL